MYCRLSCWSSLAPLHPSNQPNYTNHLSFPPLTGLPSCGLLRLEKLAWSHKVMIKSVQIPSQLRYTVHCTLCWIESDAFGNERNCSTGLILPVPIWKPVFNSSCHKYQFLVLLWCGNKLRIVSTVSVSLALIGWWMVLSEWSCMLKCHVAAAQNKHPNTGWISGHGLTRSLSQPNWWVVATAPWCKDHT